jgi:hypothetical protein
VSPVIRQPSRSKTVCLVYLVYLVYLVVRNKSGLCYPLYANSHQYLGASVRAEVDAHGEFPIDRLVIFQLGIEGPLL